MDTVNVNNNTPVKKDDVVVLDDKSTITASTDEVEIKPENDDFENKNIKLSGDEIKENQEIKRNKEIIGSIKMTLPYLKKEKKHFEMESKEAMKYLDRLEKMDLWLHQVWLWDLFTFLEKIKQKQEN